MSSMSPVPSIGRLALAARIHPAAPPAGELRRPPDEQPAVPSDPHLPHLPPAEAEPEDEPETVPEPEYVPA
jgi:hypothetical protein